MGFFDSLFDDGYRKGNVGNYNYSVKVYNEPSKHGINGGRVSKLTIREGNREICHYDRGWDNKPTRKGSDYFAYRKIKGFFD